MANTISYKVPSPLYSKTDSYLEAEFSLTDKFVSLFEDEVSSDQICFPVNLLIEYVPPNMGANKARTEDDGDSRIEMVLPAIMNDIPITKYHNITIQVNLDTSLVDAYPSIDPSSTLSGTMVSQMCALEHDEGSEFDFFVIDTENVYSKTNTILPYEYEVSEDFKSVFLHFPVGQAYEDSCYKLVCRKDPTVIQGTYYSVEETSAIQTKYCFAKEVGEKTLPNKNCDSCNSLGTSMCTTKGV
jgi:hypothetical protein